MKLVSNKHFLHTVWSVNDGGVETHHSTVGFQLVFGKISLVQSWYFCRKPTTAGSHWVSAASTLMDHTILVRAIVKMQAGNSTSAINFFIT